MNQEEKYNLSCLNLESLVKCVIQTESLLTAHVRVGFQPTGMCDLCFVHFIISHVHSAIHSSQWQTQILNTVTLKHTLWEDTVGDAWREEPTKWMQSHGYFKVQLLNRPLIWSNRSACVCVCVWVISVPRSKWTTTSYRSSSSSSGSS